jgi:hypothetical protein
MSNQPQTRTQYSCDDLIVGSGMQGLMAARACLAHQRNCIVLEKAQGVGGILRPVIFDSIPVDAGCHIWGKGEASNINFIEEDLGIPMIPVHGHCELSISVDNIARRKLSVPSFELLEDAVRNDVIQYASTADESVIANESIGDSYPRLFGPDVGRTLLSIAERMYGRDPADLSLSAANQMAISRIKVHRCSELEECAQSNRKLGRLLCSVPLTKKSDDIVKFKYPSTGLQGLVTSCESWLTSHLQALLLGTAPRSLIMHPSNQGGVADTPKGAIEFKRLLWCCNPLALSSLLKFELPGKISTAGSPYRSFFFRTPSQDLCVEYAHDFRLDSLIFRSWIPPIEMTSASDPHRWVIVECPGIKETQNAIKFIHNEICEWHAIDAKKLEYVGSRAQVRFFPTVTYNTWLGHLAKSIDLGEHSILIPSTPLYGKDLITEWWANAAKCVSN